MKFVLLSDLGIKPTRVGNLKNNNRSSGAHYVCEVARRYGADATNIDYWLEWNRDLLVESILTWFNDEQECWIALSGSIDGSSTNEFKLLTQSLKKELPHLKVMLGGFRVPVGASDWVDIAFIGRSINIFEKWIQGQDISEFLFYKNPITYKNPTGKILEDPVNPILSAYDFFDSKETHTVEMALGCKFNCSFCGYDFRNNVRPNLSTKDKLKNSLLNAYEKFGITNFILADDTINEVDNKLILLGDVVEELPFTPSFAGFARLDIVGAKPYQIDLMRRANTTALFFGIESLNPSATKAMRKGGRPENNYKTLEMFRDKFPECFTYGNFIVGLTGDDEKSIWYHAERIVKENLLTSAGSNVLRLYSNLENPDVMSDIDNDPAKFGYTVLEDEKAWKELGYSSKSWKNDWTTVNEAEKIDYKLNQYFFKYLTSAFTAHEIQSVKTLLPDLPISSYNTTLDLTNQIRNKVIRRYIKNKSNWLKGIKSNV